MSLLPRSYDLWAIFSGLLLALAFPSADFGFLAWFALVPLLCVAHRHPFRSGFICGLSFFAFVLYWLNIVMTTYGRLHPALSVVAYLLLCAYLALYFGLSTWAACRLREVRGVALYLSLPLFWVAAEFLRSFLLSGFPWALLGYSQQGVLPLIQSADLFGVYGLSFLLLLSNGVLAGALSPAERGTRSWRLALAALLILFAANLGYGLYRLGQPVAASQKSLRVALIQGNIPQDLKWDPAFQSGTLDIYERLSLEAADASPVDLIVWPESATPFYYQQAGELSRRVDEVARQTGAHLLFGSPAYERGYQQVKYLNSAFLLSPEAQRLGRSDKIHLVPFGEYVPLASFFPFIEKLVVGIGDFSPGTVTPLPMDGLRLGTLVCFESIFPELARDYVRSGANVLVNITNDAWFGRSSAPYQHLVMSQFRAVETRTPVVRAANTGFSAFISPTGEVLERTSLFEPAALTGSLNPARGQTFYVRYGDLLPMFCLLTSLVWLVQTRRRYR